MNGRGGHAAPGFLLAGLTIGIAQIVSSGRFDPHAS